MGLFKLLYVLIAILTMTLVSLTIFPIILIESLAHRDGCHRWHSCPSDTGSYVCGDLGHGCEGSENENSEDEEEDTESLDDDRNDANNNEDSDSNGGFGLGSDNLIGNNNNDNTFLNNDNTPQRISPPTSECQGQADCFKGIVTEIVDGDTLDVNNVRVRLSLVNTPERGDSGYSEAKEFTGSMCPVGSEALVDEDDGQKEGSFDRLIGLVYCGNEKLLLNEHLLNEGHAQVFGDFCGISEFSNEDWVQRFGC
jgi:endonuclease YncB( thermonuclease family)